MSKCNYCKETNLFMCIEHKLSENNLFVVRVRYDFDCNDRNEFDIQYVGDLSFFYDIKIILLTVKKVFSMKDIGQAEKAPKSLHMLRQRKERL